MKENLENTKESKIKNKSGIIKIIIAMIVTAIITYFFTKINSSQSPYFVFPEADSFQAFQKIVSPHHFLLPLPTVMYLPALVF